MFKRIILVIFLAFLVRGVAFAQEAMIIDIKGKVLVRENAQASWGNAQLNMSVGQDWGIKTMGNSTCLLAFDSKRKNIITVKEHTEIKVESIIPGSIFLPEGRVFALIKNIQESVNFEVRTPTAVSGARGTGWLTEVIGGETNIACFDDVIYVNSLDESGEVTGRIDLVQGLEVNVEEKGVNSADVKEVKLEALQEWKAVAELIQHFAPSDNLGAKPGDGRVMPGQGNPMPPPGGQMPPPGGEMPLLGGQMPPPPDGDMPPMPDETMPPPPDGDGSWDSGAWEGDDGFGGPNDGFKDAQHEVDQTLIDQNLNTCGHFCCPFPYCCNIILDIMAKNFCLAH